MTRRQQLWPVRRVLLLGAPRRTRPKEEDSVDFLDWAVAATEKCHQAIGDRQQNNLD
jgi:hypothetical protein